MSSAALNSSDEFCAFFLHDRPFAVPVHLVKEVHAPSTVTPIPGAPTAVLGYVNLRGFLHLVIDPRMTLTGEPSGLRRDGLFIVFREDAGEAFAIHVDGVAGILHVDPEQVDLPKTVDSPANSPSTAERVVLGFAKLDQRLYTLVNPAELYASCLRRPVQATAPAARVPLPQE
jgi:purine-binding chemotaxis protein CheW